MQVGRHCIRSWISETTEYTEYTESWEVVKLRSWDDMINHEIHEAHESGWKFGRGKVEKVQF